MSDDDTAKSEDEAVRAIRERNVPPMAQDETVQLFIDVLLKKLKAERRNTDKLRGEARKLRDEAERRDAPFMLSAAIVLHDDEARTVAETAKRDRQTPSEFITGLVRAHLADPKSDLVDLRWDRMFKAALAVSDEDAPSTPARDEPDGGR